MTKEDVGRGEASSKKQALRLSKLTGAFSRDPVARVSLSCCASASRAIVVNHMIVIPF